jgi:hypothetical protein
MAYDPSQQMTDFVADIPGDKIMEGAEILFHALKHGIRSTFEHVLKIKDVDPYYETLALKQGLISMGLPGFAANIRLPDSPPKNPLNEGALSLLLDADFVPGSKKDTNGPDDDSESDSGQKEGSTKLTKEEQHHTGT